MRTKEGGQDDGAQRGGRNSAPPSPLHELGEAPLLRTCLRQSYAGISKKNWQEESCVARL